MMEHSQAFLEIVENSRSQIREVSVNSVRKKLDKQQSFYFIVIREDHEWSKGCAEGAIHLGKGIIERDIENVVLNRQDEIVLYCGGGYRSALAADALQRMGYSNVFSMTGGYKDWVQAGYPVTQNG